MISELNDWSQLLLSTSLTVVVCSDGGTIGLGSWLKLTPAARCDVLHRPPDGMQVTQQLFVKDNCKSHVLTVNRMPFDSEFLCFVACKSPGFRLHCDFRRVFLYSSFTFSLSLSCFALCVSHGMLFNRLKLIQLRQLLGTVNKPWVESRRINSSVMLAKRDN